MHRRKYLKAPRRASNLVVVRMNQPIFGIIEPYEALSAVISRQHGLTVSHCPRDVGLRR